MFNLSQAKPKELVCPDEGGIFSIVPETVGRSIKIHYLSAEVLPYLTDYL